MGTKLTQENFITKANTVHNYKYNYDKVIYISQKIKIIITCDKHGDFMQTTNNHLSGKGCLKCSIEQHALKQTLSQSDFLLRANKIHGDTYDYSLTNYTNSHVNIDIICKKHGIFSQEPTNHLCGKGCNKCRYDTIARAKVSNTDEFIKKAKNIHGDKYNYSLSNYESARKKIDIICNRHDYQFSQTPDNHLRGNGCPKCSQGVSNAESLWLDIVGVPNDKDHRQISININSKWIRADGYDEKTNTIFEFYGDFWHGNPAIYNANDMNKAVKQTFGYLYAKTIAKEKVLKDAGYNLIYIWQTDFVKQYGHMYKNLQCMRTR